MFRTFPALISVITALAIVVVYYVKSENATNAPGF